MSTLSAKDRVSLCQFSFADGRRCRTPRTGHHPHFCFDHAQKEARALAEESLSKDLAYFFSGDYLSACDLSTALGRLIPAVIRGDVKPRTARTVAYLAQTLMQAIHISQHEYGEAFGGNGWRQSIRNSVNSNHAYLYPPAPQPDQPESPHPQPQPTPLSSRPQPTATPAGCHSERSEESAFPSSSAPARQPAPSPRTPLPRTSAEFVQQVVAGLQTGGGQAPQPAPAQTRSPIPAQAPPTPAPAPSPTSAHAPQTPASSSHLNPAASTTAKTQPIPATQSPRSVVPAPQPDHPPRTGPSTPQPARNLDARALHYDHNYRLFIDGKPF